MSSKTRRQIIRGPPAEIIAWMRYQSRHIHVTWNRRVTSCLDGCGNRYPIHPSTAGQQASLQLFQTTTMSNTDIQSVLHAEHEDAPASGPIPMSFPAVLRNSKLADRFAHLRIASSVGETAPMKVKKNSREDHEGKRWVRRKDNGQRAPIRSAISTAD